MTLGDDVEADDVAVATAMDEVRSRHLKFDRGPVSVRVRADHDNRPEVARVDRDGPDGTTLVYFSVENRSYFLVVRIRNGDEPAVDMVDLEPGSASAFQVYSDSITLKELQAATRLQPTEAWDRDDGHGSGFTVHLDHPLADDPRDNLRLLLDLLETDPDGVRQLSALAKTSVELTWFGTSHMPTLKICQDDLRRMSALDVNFEILMAIS